MLDLKLFCFQRFAGGLQEWPFEAQGEQGKDLRESLQPTADSR